MSRRGTCMEHETDYGGTYTFLFSQNPSDPGSCYHCVKIYVRTVNIIEKQESKYFSTIFLEFHHSVCLQFDFGQSEFNIWKNWVCYDFFDQSELRKVKNVNNSKKSANARKCYKIRKSHHFLSILILIQDTKWVKNILKADFTILAGCVTLERGESPTLQNICRRMDPDTQLITLFAENYTPINCRSSLEGVFHFAYQVSTKKIDLKIRSSFVTKALLFLESIYLHWRMPAPGATNSLLSKRRLTILDCKSKIQYYISKMWRHVLDIWWGRWVLMLRRLVCRKRSLFRCG